MRRRLDVGVGNVGDEIDIFVIGAGHLMEKMSKKLQAFDSDIKLTGATFSASKETASSWRDAARTGSEAAATTVILTSALSLTHKT